MASYRVDKYRPSSGILSHGADASGEVRALYVDSDGYLIVNAPSDNDKGEGVSTTSSFQNVASLHNADNQNWTEAKPLSDNTGSEPHIARLLQGNRPNLDPNNAPTADDISGNSDWEVVAEKDEVSSGDYWPKRSRGGFDVMSSTLVLQVKQGSTNTATSTDNYLNSYRN